MAGYAGTPRTALSIWIVWWTLCESRRLQGWRCPRQSFCKVEGVQGKEKMVWAEKVPVWASPLLPSGLLPLLLTPSEDPFQQMSILRTRLCWQYDWTIMRHLSWVSNEVPRLSILLDNHQLGPHTWESMWMLWDNLFNFVGQSPFGGTWESLWHSHVLPCEWCGAALHNQFIVGTVAKSTNSRWQQMTVTVCATIRAND